MNKTKQIRKELKNYLDSKLEKGDLHIFDEVVNFIKKDRKKQLTLTDVGWRSEQLPEFYIDDINEIIEECKENKDSLETLIMRIWNRGLITGVNSEAEINSK